MLILIQRRRQLKPVLLGLGIDGLRRQQRHLAIVQQLQIPFDLERGRPTGKLTLLAALLDRDPIYRILAHERRNLRGKHFDVGGFLIIVQGNFLGGERDVIQRLTVEGGHGDDRFAAFDFDAADFHFDPFHSLNLKLISGNTKRRCYFFASGLPRL
ncbi:hypothetical protein D3C73_582890 [compost metagenome]